MSIIKFREVPVLFPNRKVRIVRTELLWLREKICHSFLVIGLGRDHITRLNSTQLASGAVVTQLASWVELSQVGPCDHALNSERHKKLIIDKHCIGQKARL